MWMFKTVGVFHRNDKRKGRLLFPLNTTWTTKETTTCLAWQFYIRLASGLKNRFGVVLFSKQHIVQLLFFQNGKNNYWAYYSIDF